MKNVTKYLSLILVFVMLLALAAGCGTKTLEDNPTVLGDEPGDLPGDPNAELPSEEVPADIVTPSPEVDPTEDANADLLYIPETKGEGYNVPSPSATGVATKSNAKVLLDYSNTGDGYVMVKYTGSNSKVKVIVTGPSTSKYTYDLRLDGEYDVFPLSDGNGAYKLGVYENISGTSYSTAFSHSFSVALSDEFEPFLRSNTYVNFSAASNVVAKAAELTKNSVTVLEKVEAIYKYVIKNISYDYDLAEKISSGQVSGYVPVLDDVLASGKGICFDYASVMTAMLRSQGVPTQLVFGYAGSAYHAWINVYNEESGGWVTASIYFNGTDWKLMDPTFASTANSSKKILEYIGNGANYSTKYIY